MFAILRLNTFDPADDGAVDQAFEEFDRVHSAQPGYAGSIVADLGEGRRFSVNLWADREASQRALAVLVPEVDRLLAPLMAAPSEFVGAGAVITSDVALTSRS